MEKKRFDKGQHTSLTRERKRHLESICFRWAEPKGQEAWEKRYHELVAFKAKVCFSVVYLFIIHTYMMHAQLFACSTRLGTVTFRLKVRRTRRLGDG